MTITLTPTARDYIAAAMSKQQGVGFRLSIKKTGCSGYAYVPNIIENVNLADLHFVQDDLAIYLDPACENFVKDLVIDYVVETDTLGLKQKRLVFINPNEKNRCGCGESFTIE